MIVVRQVKVVEEPDLEGINMIHTATLLAPQSELVPLMRAPQHDQLNRMFYTRLHPASNALHRQYRHNGNACS